jgi:hypothetical protein
VDNEGGSLHIEECLLEGGYWGVLNSNSAVAVLVKNKVTLNHRPWTLDPGDGNPNVDVENLHTRQCFGKTLYAPEPKTVIPADHGVLRLR